jgi:hypothetical protein
MEAGKMMHYRGGCPVCGKVISESDDLLFETEFTDHIELHNGRKTV